MFCGSGKSRLITATIIGQKKNISVVVVPSLALIQQFYDDYLSPTKVPKELSKHKLLNVSSRTQKDLLGTDVLTLDDIHIDCTTNPVDIKQFLNSNPKSKKIICVTYQSLDVLLANLDGHIIGLTCFDEAHRTASHKYKELIYGSANIGKYEKQVFFTATPVNKNGITMYDRENNDMGIYGDCGPLHPDCHYTYLNGLRDDVLSLFNIRIDMFTGASETRTVSLYECIARSILATGNSRVLTFHKDVAIDSNSDTSVLRFIQNGQTEFKCAFDRICANEFPEKTGFYNKITLVGLTAGTKDKKEVLSEFGKCADNEIFILASCGTIGEGVDTKNANMTVFVDPKTSVKDIIQNIGRVCRKIPGTNRPAATVLIPVWVDMRKYRDCGDDVEKRDEVLREQLNLGEKGDYNAVLNVCAALQQEDQELYDLCLRYPSNFTEAEREHTLTKQGCRVDYDAEPIDECDIEELIESGQRVEIHTNNPDEPVIIHNEHGQVDDSVCLYAYEDTFGTKKYYSIVHNGVMKRQKRPRNLDIPRKTNRPRIDYNINDQMRILWKVADDTDFSKRINSAVIECNLERLDNVEIWKNKHSQMCKFIDTHKTTPSKTAKNPLDITEKIIGQWISRQKENYDPIDACHSKQIMKNQEIWQIWRDTLDNHKYNEYLADRDPIQNWKNKHNQMCKFIDKHKTTPNTRSKDPILKKLGQWVQTQKANYVPISANSSNYIMKNQEIWQIWTDTLADSRYNLTLDRYQYWKYKHEQMCKFIDTYKRAPSRSSLNNITSVENNLDKNNWAGEDFRRDRDHSKNDIPTYIQACEQELNREQQKNIESVLVGWFYTQKKDYNSISANFSQQIMKNQEIWQIWTDTLCDLNYNEYLVDTIQDWKNIYRGMCKFIDAKDKSPSINVKDPSEKKLEEWVNTQKTNYNPISSNNSENLMKNHEIWQMWTFALANTRYMRYLGSDPVQDWKNKHIHMCKFITVNGRLPSVASFENVKLKKLVNTEKPNITLEEIEKIEKEIDKTIIEEKNLVTWIHNQKTNYNSISANLSQEIMKNEEIWQIWKDTLADSKYNEYLPDIVKDWKNKHIQMCNFINTNKRLPIEKSQDPTEKTLGEWVINQKRNYDTIGPITFRYTMNQEIWQIWTDTLADTKYNKYLSDPDIDWYNRKYLTVKFIDINKRAPLETSNDPTEKILGYWVSVQKMNYNPNGSILSKQIMKTNPEIWERWKYILESPKYMKYLVLYPVRDWKNIHILLCKFIDKHKRAPLIDVKDLAERQLGQWVNEQKKCYDPIGSDDSKYIMKTNSEIWQIWTDTLAHPKYMEYLKYEGEQCFEKTSCSNPVNTFSQSSTQVSLRSSSPIPSSQKTSKKSHILPTTPKQIDSHENIINFSCETYHCFEIPCHEASCRNREKSEYQKIGTSWAIQNSTTTHDYLSKHPEQWEAYHDARDFSFKGYTDQSQIPRNRIITHLEKKAKHKLRILDLGCGRNYIAQHFREHAKMKVIGYDHVVEKGSRAKIGNILDLCDHEEDENTDICVYSQSLMGTDKMEYLREGYRMLRYGGEMIICDSVNMIDDVKSTLLEIGMKIEELEHNESRWFLLCARKC